MPAPRKTARSAKAGKTAIDPRGFRDLLGRFATGVTIVTARDRRGRPVGVTINSFTSVSLEPPMVLFCLGAGARCHGVFADAGYFAVNFLAAEQKKLSQHFAGIGSRQWGRVPYGAGDHGCPLLPGSLGRWSAKIRAISAGDHTIFIGAVTELLPAAGRRAAQPLLYFASNYRRLKAS